MPGTILSILQLSIYLILKKKKRQQQPYEMDAVIFPILQRA